MKTLIDLEHHECRWPVAREDGQHLFCGEARGSSPYCSRHAKLAYEPKRPAPWVPGATKYAGESKSGGFHDVRKAVEPSQEDCVDAFAAVGAV